MGSQLVIPVKKRQDFIRNFHDSLFAGHLGITRMVYRLLDRVYWPGLRGDVQTYIKSCTVCIARKSPCPRKVPMGRGCGSSLGTGSYGFTGHVGHHNTG